MKIFVKAKAGAKENKVIPPEKKLFSTGEQDEYIIYVKEPPIEGKANRAIMKLLAEYFKISQSQIRLISGLTSKKKVFEIPDMARL